MLFGILSVGIGLVGTNFFYEAMTGQNWARALDRSVFQVVAMVAIPLTLMITQN